MAGSRPALVRDVIVTIDGVTHRGTYFVRGKMVHVRSSFGNIGYSGRRVAARDLGKVAALGACALFFLNCPQIRVLNPPIEIQCNASRGTDDLFEKEAANRGGLPSCCGRWLDVRR